MIHLACKASAWRRFRSFAVAGLFFIFLGGLEVLQTSAAEAKSHNPIRHPKGGYTIYVIPHSHMDLEWFWTYEQTQAFSIRILRQALKLLKEDPRFAFTQDQVLALKPFWESLSSDDQDFLRRMVTEGRFEVTTGMLVQPDVNEPDFESLTRQLLLGKPWMDKTFGANVLTAWNLDTFGQTIQMPQLFGRAGLRYFFFSRDFPPQFNESTKNLFYWRSPDGSQVLAHLNRYFWGVGLNPKYASDYPDLLATSQKSLQEVIRRNPEGNDKIVIPWGMDVYLPTETSKQIEQWTRKAAAKIGIPVKSVLISTPSRYFRDVENSRVSLPTYTYDFNPPLVLQDLRGLWAQRPGLKLMERRSEDLLESSEKLSSLMSLSGLVYPQRELSWGWQGVLENHNHDTMAGSNSDAVNQIAMSRYSGAIEVARKAESGALFHLSRKIDTSRAGNFALVVFNPLSFARTDVIRYEVTFVQEQNMTMLKVKNFRLLDSANNRIPFRVVALSRTDAIASEMVEGEVVRTSSQGEGPLTTAVIEFLAEKVPALGYRVYHIEPIEGSLQTPRWRDVESEVSNRFFTLNVDPQTGSISKLVDRRNGREWLISGRHSGNELVLLEESHPNMEGMLHLTGKEIRGNQSKPDSVKMIADEYGTTIRITAPFLEGKRIQEIKLYEQLPRIDFRTELKGFPGHDGLLTVSFPVSHRESKKTWYETHNAVIERPDGIYPAHNWVDLADSNGGLAIINRGTGGHQIEGDDAKLLLLRSVQNFTSYYAPSASEAGDHVFEYSLYPHTGDWSGSGVVEQSRSFNSPLRVIPTDAHEGKWPLEKSFLSVPSENFEITALKKAEEGGDLILRGYEKRGRVGRVQLQIQLPLEQGWFTDLLEQSGKEAAVYQGTIEFDCQPFEFVTLRLRMKPSLQ